MDAGQAGAGQTLFVEGVHGDSPWVWVEHSASLQAFLEFTDTVKHGNFTGAEGKMGISPSAVAKSIGRLEEDLGLRLFHRTTRR